MRVRAQDVLSTHSDELEEALRHTHLLKTNMLVSESSLLLHHTAAVCMLCLVHCCSVSTDNYQEGQSSEKASAPVHFPG